MDLILRRKRWTVDIESEEVSFAAQASHRNLDPRRLEGDGGGGAAGDNGRRTAGAGSGGIWVGGAVPCGIGLHRALLPSL